MTYYHIYSSIMRLSCHALEIMGSQWNYRVQAVNRGYRSQIPDILNITLYVQPWIASYYSLQHTVTQQRRLTQTRGEKWSMRSCKAAKQTSNQLVKQLDRFSCTAAGGPHVISPPSHATHRQFGTHYAPGDEGCRGLPREEALDERGGLSWELICGGMPIVFPALTTTDCEFIPSPRSYTSGLVLSTQ